MTVIELDALVAEDLKNVKEIIGNSGIYSAVLHQLSGDTRNTPSQITYLEAYETSLAVFRAASLELRKIMDVMTLEQKLAAHALKKEGESGKYGAGLSNQIRDAVFYSNRHALAFAGHVGLALLGLEKAAVQNRFTFGSIFDASRERDDLTSKLADVATDDLNRVISEKMAAQEEIGDEDLKFTLQAIFTSWINQFNWKTWEGTAERNNGNAGIRYKTYSVERGEFKRKYNAVKVDEKFMRVRRGDVIGSQEFHRTVWNSLLKLAAYDDERQQNPFDPPLCIFTYGEPGGGKTFTAHAYIQSLADLCREKGIPLWAMTHSTTDYASHYQNLTANALAELAGQIRAFSGAVVMYVADADNIFQSRKDERLTAEQQQTLAVYFKMFDGTMIPKNGKFMAIMDANYVDGIDDATKSRLFDEIVELKRFDNAEDFAELFRRSMTSGMKGLEMDIDWAQIGQYLLGSPLSNREIGHVTRRLRGEFQVPEDAIGKPFDELLKIRNDYIAGLTKEGIIAGFDQYITTRMEIERASAIRKQAHDLSRFFEALTKTNPGETHGRS